MATQHDKNEAVIDALARGGSDLTKPHGVELFLYFPSKKIASEVAAELKAAGCSVEVRPSAEPWWKRLISRDKWLCLATKTLPMNNDSMDELTEWAEELAARFGGTFDGWGTPIVK